MKDKYNQFFNRIKFVKTTDVKSVFIMIPAFIYSLYFRFKHKNIWLICERKSEARDNGYWFYKYVCEYHPEIEAIYAIDLKSPDVHKVIKLGKVIQFGGFNHWVYYFSAQRNISSQKEGKPNAAICYVLEVYLNLVKNRAYIRHGICKDDQRWVYYDVTKMNLFVCSASREYEYVKKKFGYPERNVKLVGLCRYDNLLVPHHIKKQILVMPTMREWLRNESSDTDKYEKSRNFCDSEYFSVWNKLLKNHTMIRCLEKYEVDLIFYPHSSMQKYINNFDSSSDRIYIVDPEENDVQTLLVESSWLITDYSSIFFDFAYMKKPLIYYQFDYKKYRSGQYQEGYFSYIDDGFGTVCYDEDSLLSNLEFLLKNNKMETKFANRVDNFFEFKDTNNCRRTFVAIKEMK